MRNSMKNTNINSNEYYKYFETISAPFYGGAHKSLP